MQKLGSTNSPVGTIIQIGENTPEERFNTRFFRKYLFEYFEELTSGQTGFGMSFNTWLEISHGWKNLDWHKYEKIFIIE